MAESAHTSGIDTSSGAELGGIAAMLYGSGGDQEDPVEGVLNTADETDVEAAAREQAQKDQGLPLLLNLKGMPVGCASSLAEGKLACIVSKNGGVSTESTCPIIHMRLWPALMPLEGGKSCRQVAG